MLYKKQVFDPKKIVIQILALQLLFYVGLIAAQLVLVGALLLPLFYMSLSL